MRSARSSLGIFLLGSALWLSCQAGELPCESSAEWQALCDQTSAGGTGGGAGTGGTGGGAGTGGNGGGGALLSASTPVPDCAQWTTLGAMDNFFSSRCGLNSMCHGAGAPWTAMPVQGVWAKFTSESSAAMFSCTGAKLTNRTTWTDSVLWTKTQTPPLPCAADSTNKNTGLSMPPQTGFPPKTDPLSTAELKCLEGFLKAIAGAP
jgi:hypothetical protein